MARPNPMVVEGHKRLERVLAGLDFGSATLRIIVQDGTIVRIVVTREESLSSRDVERCAAEGGGA